MDTQLEFDRHICTNLAEATQRVWLETNGIGGIAAFLSHLLLSLVKRLR